MRPRRVQVARAVAEDDGDLLQRLALHGLNRHGLDCAVPWPPGARFPLFLVVFFLNRIFFVAKLSPPGFRSRSTLLSKAEAEIVSELR